MTRRGLLGLWAATFAVLAGAYLVLPDRDPSGDEPQYLMLAQSIVLDGDADLTNDLAIPERNQRSLPGADTFDPHGGDYRGDGRIRTVHPPGLPVLLAPAVLIARALDVSLVDTARLEVAAMAATATVLLLLLALDLAPRRRGHAVLATLAVVATIPVLPFGTQVFPEVPALAVVLAALLALRRPPSTGTGIVVGTAAAALPWLQVRFVPIAAGLALAYVVVGARRLGWARLGWLLPLGGPLLLSLVALNVYDQAVYGSPSLTAAYTIPPYDEHRLSLSTLYHEGVGNFLSSSSGWFPHAPVAIVGVAAACAVAVRRRSVVAWVVGAAFAAYAVTSGATSTQGGAMPGRFLVVVAPAAAVGILGLLRAGGRLAAATTGLLALSVAVGAAGLDIGDRLIDEPGYATAPLARLWAPLFPTLVNDDIDTLSTFVVAPGTARTTGREAQVDGAPAVVAEHGVDASGFLAFGPYARAYPARWEVDFPLRVDGPADEDLVCIDVAVDAGATVLASRCVGGGVPGWRHERLAFVTDRRDVVETRVHWRGQGTAAVSTVVAEQVEDLRPSRGWPWVAAWMLALAALATWLVPRLDP